MTTVFLDRRGILLLDWLPEKTTSMAIIYRRTERIAFAIKREKRGELSPGVSLQHDNARPHVSSKPLAGIRELGFECIPHLPYSPDLAPWDYWLFSSLKRPLREKRFPDFKGLVFQVKQWGKCTPDRFFTTGLEKYPEHLKRFVDLKV